MQEPDEKPRATNLTVEQYLRFEEQTGYRHEYVAGHIFAMTGATQNHISITLNIAAALHARLKGTSCRVFVNDLKVHLKEKNSFYYPDVTVVCSKLNGKSNQTSNPSLIVEVLSPSTWMIDKREKLVAYQSLDSLREYMVVHQSKMMIEMHQRNTNGIWETHIESAKSSAAVLLSSIPNGEFQLSFDTIYDGIDMDQPTDHEGIIREESAEYMSDENLSQANW